jgi:putative Ca2+/H+ antiporter (TMEM165/GDT1 family)
MTGALLGTFGLIVVAELGDKTQLLVAWLATKYRPRTVLLGVLLGSSAIHLLSAGLGGALSEIVAPGILEVGAGLLFVGFGLWALFSRTDDGDPDAMRVVRWPALSIAGTFFIAELGDKTQLAALTRAAQFGASADVTAAQAFWAVWIGATLGMLVADGLAVLAGSFLATRVSRRLLSRVSGVVFLGFGAYTLGGAIL